MPASIQERWPRWQGRIRVVIRDARTGRFLPGGRAFNNLIVNQGLNLLRDGLIGAATDTQIHYVAIGTGCGTLSTGFTNGQTGITTLHMSAGVPFPLFGGQTLVLMNGASSQTVTVASGGATTGATSIPVNSFTASAAFAATTTSVTPQTDVANLALSHEVFRKAVTVQSASATGQALTTLFLSPQDANIVIAEIGWYAGATAGPTTDSGVLVARVLYNHTHTNLESIDVARTDVL